jgi:hypothetical protein
VLQGRFHGPFIQTLLTFSPKPTATLVNLLADAHFRNELAALLIMEDTTDSQSPTLLDRMPSSASNTPYINALTGETAAPGASATPGDLLIPPGILAAQNNNPGNLRFARQSGAMPGAGGFAQFSTPVAGYQALVDQVQLDASRGVTLGQYITKYAPPSENDTALYIQQASQALGVDANTPLALIDPNRIAAFQVQKESGAIILRSLRR